MLGQCPRGSPSPLFYGVICSRPNDELSCQHQKYKKMVFLAAIREKSQRGVALSCDAHVVSAKSVGIRQPCTESLSETASCRTFFSVQHFCAGNYGTTHCLQPFDWPNRWIHESWSKVFGVRNPEISHRFLMSNFLRPCQVSTQ